MASVVRWRSGGLWQMGQSDRIRAGIRKLAQEAAPWQMQIGTVENVDETSQVCDVRIDEDYILHDVRLTPVEGADILLIPAEGSWAFIAAVNNDEFFHYLAAASAISKVVARLGDAVIEIANGRISINGGSNNGLVNIGALVGDLDTIKKDLNTLKTAFKSWIVNPQDGGAALKTAAATWASQTMQMTDRDKLEDNKITH